MPEGSDYMEQKQQICLFRYRLFCPLAEAEIICLFKWRPFELLCVKYSSFVAPLPFPNTRHNWSEKKATAFANNNIPTRFLRIFRSDDCIQKQKVIFWLELTQRRLFEFIHDLMCLFAWPSTNDVIDRLSKSAGVSCAYTTGTSHVPITLLAGVTYWIA